MKKLLTIVVLVTTFLSCKNLEETTYEVTIEVHYPSRVDTIEVKGVSSSYPELSSFRGTNYVGDLYSNTTPLRILNVKETSVNCCE